MTNKSGLRKQLRQDRLKQSGEERQAKSALICEHLLALVDWSQIRFLHYYEPLMELGEVDISGFITDLGKVHPQIDLFTTRKFDDIWQVTPIDETGNVRTPEFDVIVVPMLGFDPASLQRIGYGGGFYDKFLATQTQAQKIGVCFELGKTTNLPTEPHDVPLDQIVTETKIYI
ncbi:MAG TPA: 5-formyltetrahydrofolate cyclo-ligase [Candidatus Saccharimonadales bacterium]|nr:5-formyltetrahydrofolate cyclo-ligase [Candidatus Saccharimonadales bacterium]